MNATSTMLVPQYFYEFSCIGPACEDSCCTGWQIEIDEKTYERYQASRDEELQPLFQRNVERNASGSSASFAKMKMQHGSCSFLSGDGLCSIQAKLGEEFLSNTCAIYPRYINRVNGVIEKSLTMSCPEAARLVLLNPNGIEFDQVEDMGNSRTIIVNDVQTSGALQYFWELRIFTIEMLQNRSYSVNERLLLLGLFLQEVQEAIDAHRIESLISQYRDLLEQGTAKQLIASLSVQAAVQVELCKQLLDIRAAEGLGNERYIGCLVETLQGMQYKQQLPIEEIAERYKKAQEQYFAPFMQEHGYILENYVVNYVFKNLFPCKRETVLDDYMMLIIHYALIQFHLIGMAGYHKGLTADLAVLLIQSFSKSFEHSKAFLERAPQVLKEKGYTTMERLAVLVKQELS